MHLCACTVGTHIQDARYKMQDSLPTLVARAVAVRNTHLTGSKRSELIFLDLERALQETSGKSAQPTLPRMSIACFPLACPERYAHQFGILFRDIHASGLERPCCKNMQHMAHRELFEEMEYTKLSVSFQVSSKLSRVSIQLRGKCHAQP